MEMRRKRYPTKRAWAEAKVAELRESESRLRAERVPSADWRRVRTKMDALDHLTRERLRFQRLVERFAAEGV